MRDLHFSTTRCFKFSGTVLRSVPLTGVIYSLQVQFAEQQIIKRRVKRDIYFKDPLFPKQWFLVS